MAAEMPREPRKDVASSHRESGVERQTTAAAANQLGPQTECLMEEVLHSENLMIALKKVTKKKRKAPGVDGMTVKQLPAFLRKKWPVIREQLLNGTYIPTSIRRKDIPKPGKGKGTRMLGIPTVLDRFIQQAILLVLTPIFDPGFSDHSFGFRPGRSAHHAVKQARGYMAEGYQWVVDMDLEKFFDQVNHDILMSRVARKVKDKRLLKLIRRYLTAGIMDKGMVTPRERGTPQGGPLSPLLSNVMLDDLDKELERREHRFCRYADDCNIYVKSKTAGERVMASLTRFLERKLRLKVNRKKSAVDRPCNRKFLGYSVTRHRYPLLPRLRPAPGSIRRAKDRIREITHKGRGRNIRKVIEELNSYTRGWRNYFRLSEVVGDFKTLDGWLRRRLRKILWQQWKNPRNRRRQLLKLGVPSDLADAAKNNGRGAWWNAGSRHMNYGVSTARLTQWGLLKLLQMHRTL
jgi:RNA-directed DNA polymerase